MPRRKKIEGFMPEVRQMITKRIIDRGFQGYTALAEELTQEGHAVSKSSLHRFAMGFRQQARQAEREYLLQQVEDKVRKETK